jgi:toluene monooxygenase system protein E
MSDADSRPPDPPDPPDPPRPPRAPRPRRTFSAFGDVRKMPSEYEIVTEAQNWTLRPGRPATFEQNPSSPANLWFRTYRENSPLRAERWDDFRDPDALTYRAYVTGQSDAETKVAGVLEAHAGAEPAAGTAALLAALLTPSRYLSHGFQQVEAYIGFMAPSPYITTAAGYSTADFLRRVTTIAYRTRQLQLAHPDSGAGSAERSRWEDDDGWQPARRAVEYALVTYDWAEAFTALNLVLAPTLDDVLLTQLGQAARDQGDELTWLLTSFLAQDARRRERWSTALAALAVGQRPGNRAVLAKWAGRWSALADDAALGLGTILAAAPGSQVTAAAVAAHARAAREALLDGLLAAPGPAGHPAADPAAAG